ncbi:MAG: DedA family protein [Planctomycetes bacterium]|nr:DedA family protein [Planctomycetota bacterium]
MHWEELVKEYGYLILLIGTLLEGETIVILAGFLARRGYLDFAYVALISFIGTFFADQTLFQIGRRYGARILDRWPRLRRAVKRVWRLLGRFQNLYIFGSRFLYGFRTISPLALGSAGVATRRFLTFNGLGAMVWAICIPAIGYSLGMALESVMAEVHRYELMVLAGMLTVSGVILLIHWLRLRSKADANHSECTAAREVPEQKTAELKEDTRRS